MINCKMLAYSQAGSSRTLSLLDFEICQNRHNALSSTWKHQLITQIFNLGQHDWCAYFDERCICNKFSWQVFSSWHFTKEFPRNARNESDVPFLFEPKLTWLSLSSFINYFNSKRENSAHYWSFGKLWTNFPMYWAAVAEWFRRWIRNPMGYSRAGSNPACSVWPWIFTHVRSFSLFENPPFAQATPRFRWSLFFWIFHFCRITITVQKLKMCTLRCQTARETCQLCLEYIQQIALISN